ncbi:hypothetical protein AB0B63_18670 [Micromonospora sp. NPDC049081]|uniref:hypothetical protein n=1 Tax=Micromonospora sp. NPDC049081 TaxID=3155150 RepID=UPI0033C4D3C7
MTAATIIHSAGTARPLLSGGWADCGGTFPTIVTDRDASCRVLDALAQAKVARR